MGNVQHTPKRWTVNPLLFRDVDTGKPTGVEYWIMDADDNEIACVDDEETARLIAAAPELLEALKLGLAELNEYTNGVEQVEAPGLFYAIEQAKAAIAKATGQALEDEK